MGCDGLGASSMYVLSPCPVSAICSFSAYSTGLTEDIRSSPFAVEILLLILLHTHVIAGSHGSGHLLDQRIITEVYGIKEHLLLQIF